MCLTVVRSVSVFVKVHLLLDWVLVVVVVVLLLLQPVALREILVRRISRVEICLQP